MAKEISSQQLFAEDVLLIDVREPHEHQIKHIAESKLLPLSELEKDPSLAKQFNSPLVLYCQSGLRSQTAQKIFAEQGVEAVSLTGGIEDWEKDYPVLSPLSPEQRERYSRQVLLKQIGSEGQSKLSNSKVLLIGVGGLGSPVSLYLAAAGVNLGLIDDDQVEVSNLQRQVVHSSKTIGLDKVDSAKQHLQALNPLIDITTYNYQLTRDNILDILPEYDLVIDGTDNFPARYLLNDAAIRLNKPVVSASILEFSGQVTAFIPNQGACYRCLYPTPPPPELAPSCSAAGVLGIMAGTVGLLQANEAVKILLDIGETLVGKLLIYEALTNDFTTLNTYRNPDCPTCSPEAQKDTQRELPDYVQFCAVR